MAQMHPYDAEDGDACTGNTIRSIELMNIPKHEKDMIFEVCEKASPPLVKLTIRRKIK